MKTIAPGEWTEKDLLSLIEDGVQESVGLDYKSCDSLQKTDGKKKEVSKDVSAFANSAGGVLIYGIVESNNLPVVIDTGYDPADITREWLEQVINAGIQRRINGITICQVDLTESAPGKVAYVVTVPQSTRAPHMAADNRFYKRFNFASVPMEEYEVRDTGLRQESPDLIVEFSLDGAGKHLVTYAEKRDYSDSQSLGIAIRNLAPTPAEYCVIRIFVDSRIKILSNPGYSLKEGVSILALGGEYGVSMLSANWNIPAKMPIWEGVPFSVGDHPILLSLPAVQDNYVLGWQVLSPRMQEKSQYFTLVLKDGILSLIERH